MGPARACWSFTVLYKKLDQNHKAGAKYMYSKFQANKNSARHCHLRFHLGKHKLFCIF